MSGSQVSRQRIIADCDTDGIVEESARGELPVGAVGDPQRQAQAERPADRRLGDTLQGAGRHAFQLGT